MEAAHRLLDAREVMRRTTLSRAAIQRVFAKGELRTGRLGRKVVVLEADLNAWIEAHLAPKKLEG